MSPPGHDRRFPVDLEEPAVDQGVDRLIDVARIADVSRQGETGPERIGSCGFIAWTIRMDHRQWDPLPFPGGQREDPETISMLCGGRAPSLPLPSF